MAHAQELVYYFDDQGRACVDICAKSLDILDGDDCYSWKYDLAQRHGCYVHYAEMLKGVRLEVQGEHSAVRNFTPNTRYKVFFKLSMKNNAWRSFKHPFTFQFINQEGNKKEFTYQLGYGSSKVLVGEFVSVAGPCPRNVKVKMSNHDSFEKSGLVVHCITITPANN